MDKEHLKKLEKLVKWAEKQPKFFLEEGKLVWGPCSGQRFSFMDGPDIPTNHVGNIIVATAEKDKYGNTVLKHTEEWLSEKEAKTIYGEGLIISNSHGLCPNCREMMDLSDKLREKGETFKDIDLNNPNLSG